MLIQIDTRKMSQIIKSPGREARARIYKLMRNVTET